jgi:hypothetical protein
MISRGKAATGAANNLIHALKRVVRRGEEDDGDIFAGRRYVRAPSGGFLTLDQECLKAIDRAVRYLQYLTGSYPLDSLKSKLETLVLGVWEHCLESGTAHKTLRVEVLNLIDTLSCQGDWEVLHTLRGVAASVVPTTIGCTTIRTMDESLFREWGKRFTTGTVDPPTDTEMSPYWVHEEVAFLGQVVATCNVRAVDAVHAIAEGRRCTQEAVDLIRYRQVADMEFSDPAPDLGLSAISEHEFVAHKSVCISVNEHRASTQSYGKRESAIIDSRWPPPAWTELDNLLRIPTTNRSEMQRRMMNGLAWVGQAAIARSNAIRLVALITALESMLIGKSEAMGKRRKISERVSQFPQMRTARRHIDAAEADRLYRLRSACVHSGKTDIADSDVGRASMAVAQTFSGILCDETRADILTLSQVLATLPAKT